MKSILVVVLNWALKPFIPQPHPTSVVIFVQATAETQVTALICLNDGTTALAFSPDGSSLAAPSDDGVVLVWEIAP